MSDLAVAEKVNRNSGQFRAGRRVPGAGRKKGVPNKINGDIRLMIWTALHNAGGEKYLTRQAKKNPVAFMTLVGKTLPKEFKADVGPTLAALIEQSLKRDGDGAKVIEGSAKLLSEAVSEAAADEAREEANEEESA